MKFKIFLFILALVITPTTLNAQIPVAAPFGGPILMVYECSCNGSWYVLMYDYKTLTPVPMAFQFGASVLRANYNIFTPKVQTLGSYVPGGACLVASLDCADIGVQGVISPIGMPGVGTGLY